MKICDKLDENVKNFFVDLTNTSKKEKIEVGALICKMKDKFVPGKICKGDACTLVITNCKEKDAVGSFHTHPSGPISMHDIIHLIYRNYDFICISHIDQNTVKCYEPDKKSDIYKKYEKLIKTLNKYWKEGNKIEYDKLYAKIKQGLLFDDHFMQFTAICHLLHFSEKLHSSDEKFVYYSRQPFYKIDNIMKGLTDNTFRWKNMDFIKEKVDKFPKSFDYFIIATKKWAEERHYGAFLLFVKDGYVIGECNIPELTPYF